MGAYEHRGEMESAEPESLNLGMSYPGSGAPPGAHQSGVALLGSGAACSAVSYADWLAAQLGSGAAAPIAPRNAVACPEVLPPHFGSALPPANRSAAPRTGMLTAHGGLSGGLPTAGQNGAPPDLGMLTAHLGSGMSNPASWNSVAAYPGSGAPPAAVNGVAYTGGHVYEGVAGFDFDHLNPTGTAAAAAGQDGGYDDSSGLPLPFADKVVDDVDWDDDKVAGAAAERARGAVLGRLGLAATALAVAGITAGGAATPATALGVFAMLIAGVTLVNVRVLRA